MLLLFACAHGPIAAPAPTVTGADVLWFDLEGSDRVDLLVDCASNCPKDESGTAVASLTSWALDWSWTRRPVEPCEVDGASVHVDVTVTLPRWSPPADADPALVEEWSAYILALTVHEQGHVDLVHAHARDSEDRIAAAGCGGAHEAGRGMLDQLRVAQHAYDADTSSGHRQGANFWRIEGRRAMVSTE